MLTGLIERLLKTPDEWSWPRLASKLIVIWPILVILLGFYWLVPRFTFKDLGSLDAVDRDQIQRFIEDVHTSVTAPSKTPDSKNVATKPFFVPSCQDCTDYRETTLALTPLVQLLVKVPVTVFVNSRDATGLSYSYDLRDPEYYPTVRVDNLVLMFLILVGVTLGLRAVRLSPVVGLVADFSARSRGTAKPITAEAVLEADVVKAEERARDVYKRSTILLGGGIVMAFVGVALFYVTLPSPSAGPSDEQITTLRERADYYSFLLRRYEAFNENRGRSGVPDDLRQLPLPDPHATGDEHPWLTFASHSLIESRII